jgi:hypothetical protein
MKAVRHRYAEVLSEYGKWSVMFMPTRPQDLYPYALLDGFGLSAAEKARELDQQDHEK